VAYRGVSVGSAHMSWIDTPMVQDAKKDLGAFRMMLDRMPGPLARTTTVDECADAFVRGIERRARRVNVPRWVGAMRWLKPVLTTRLGERQVIKDAAEIVPLMDQEVVEMGRSVSERVAALERHPAATHSD